MKERMWVSNRNTWFARARDCSIWYEMEPEEKINKAEHTTMFDQEIVWNELFFFHSFFYTVIHSRISLISLGFGFILHSYIVIYAIFLLFFLSLTLSPGMYISINIGVLSVRCYRGCCCCRECNSTPSRNIYIYEKRINNLKNMFKNKFSRGAPSERSEELKRTNKKKRRNDVNSDKI